MTKADEITPTMVIAGMLKNRQAIAEPSNTLRLRYGNTIAVRLTARKEIVNPRKPEIGPSRCVNAYSASQISAPAAEIRIAQCGEWYRSLTSPSHSGATTSMLQASNALGE